MGFFRKKGSSAKDEPKATASPPATSSPATDSGPAGTEERIREALKAVQDPDLHKDIVTLGFVKAIEVLDKEARVVIELTTPACPVKDQLKAQAEQVIMAVAGIEKATVTMTAQTVAAARGGKEDATKEALAGVRNIIAVASGKGGVGKSTTTVNLAFALARQGARVGLMDADIYGPSIPLMTGVGKPTEVDGKMVIPPQVDGIKIISVAMFMEEGKASILRGPMTAQIIQQFLTQIKWGDLDYLLIDYPPGTGDIQLTLSQMCPVSGAVIVTTPQEVSLIDVRKAVNMFGTMKVPVLGVIENMSYFICDGCEKKHHIFREGGGRRVAAENGLPVLGEIPLEPAIAKAGDEGHVIGGESVGTGVHTAWTEAAGKVASQVSILNMNEAGAADFSLEWKD